MSQGLAALRQRKKELLLESDINRQILRVEVCQLQIKATEWRQNLLKVRNAYKWIAPLAGVGFGIYSVRKKLQGATGARRNGRTQGKSDYLKLLAPIGFAALQKAFSFWQQARKRKSHAGNGAT